MEFACAIPDTCYLPGLHPDHGSHFAHDSGLPDAGADWLNTRLRELWAGDAEELVGLLEAEALGLAPRPGPEGSAARVLWTARDYFDEHRERIRYDTFRRHGLPLTSAHVESGIKQTNNRVKGSEKQWLLRNAEAMLALRCLGLSEDGRWDGYFEALRRGEVAPQTPGRADRRPADVLPLTRNLRKTG